MFKNKINLGLLGFITENKKLRKTNKQQNKQNPWLKSKEVSLFVFLGFFVLLIYTGQSRFFPQILFSLKFVIPMCTSSTPRKHMCAPSWPFGKLLKPLGKKNTAKKRSFKMFLFSVGGALAYIHIHMYIYIYTFTYIHIHIHIYM